MKITQSKTKSETVRKALQGLIDQEKRKNLITYRGKIDFERDLDVSRDR